MRKEFVLGLLGAGWLRCASTFGGFEAVMPYIYIYILCVIVFWLSGSACLFRFFSAFNEIIQNILCVGYKCVHERNMLFTY